MHNKSKVQIELKTLGADPEYFISDGTQALPSSIFTRGTKEAPESLGGGFNILVDNLAIEGNIPPATDKAMWIAQMAFLDKQLERIVGVKTCFILKTDSVNFAGKFLNLAPARIYGCSPYYLAWELTDEGIPKITIPHNLDKEEFRSAGFHIHIGYSFTSEVFSKRTIDILIAKLFDLLITIPARKVYNDEFRDKFYGELGAFRPKSYGIECRSLGSYFTNTSYLGWIWESVSNIMNTINNVLTEDQIRHLVDFQLTSSNNKAFASVSSAIYEDLLNLDIDKFVPTIKNLEKIKNKI